MLFNLVLFNLITLVIVVIGGKLIFNTDPTSNLANIFLGCTIALMIDEWKDYKKWLNSQ